MSWQPLDLNNEILEETIGEFHRMSTPDAPPADLLLARVLQQSSVNDLRVSSSQRSAGSRAVLDGPGAVQSNVNVRPQSVRRVATWSISVLACALLLVVVFSLRTGSSAGVAYAIDDLPKRLVEVNTIALRGWRYIYDDSDKQKPPILEPFECLVKRPGKVRQIGLTILQHDDRVEVRRSLHVCDGAHQAEINEDGSLQSSRFLNPIDVRLITERQAQFAATAYLIDPSNSAYRKVGKDNVDGVRCDLWESQVAGETSIGIHRLWINPANGLPVRSVSDVVNHDGTTQRQLELTEIAFNTPLDDKLFRISDPHAAQATGRPQAANVSEIPLSRPTTGCGEPRPYASLNVWHALKISEKATLLIWGRTTPPTAAHGTRDWLSGVTMTVTENGKKHALHHAWLYESDTPERWNWSLLTTADGKPFGRRVTTIALRTPNTECTLPINAIEFKDAELQQILNAARRGLLPDHADEVTLSDLRAQASRLLESKDAR